VIDEVLCFFSPGPRTATGEDIAEIHGHGGAVVLAAITEAAVSCGARPARPGEFTYRAFCNGKMDLSQAEAVMSLIGARSRRAAREAVKQLAGGLGARLGAHYQTLTNVAAHLEAGLDFPDEDLPIDELRDLARRLKPVLAKLSEARDSFSLGDRLTRGASIAICGPANAGKSSVLNRLSMEDRAIVDDEPGTTRDVVEASIELAGVPVVLKDTAGLRTTSSGVERRGICKTLETIEASDLVLMVLDGTLRGRNEEEAVRLLSEAQEAKILVVVNKSDLPGWGDEVPAPADGLSKIAVSALDGSGFPELADAIVASLGVGEEPREIVLTTSRQHAAVASAVEHCERAMGKLAAGRDPELAATELRWARESLATLWGRDADDEMIEALFSTFCIGK